MKHNVIQCKDCVSFGKRAGWCGYWKTATQENHFCSHGHYRKGVVVKVDNARMMYDGVPLVGAGIKSVMKSEKEVRERLTYLWHLKNCYGYAPFVTDEIWREAAITCDALSWVLGLDDKEGCDVR